MKNKDEGGWMKDELKSDTPVRDHVEPLVCF